MDGARALMYARTRYADDDYQRGARQQQVVSALLGKLVNPIYWLPALSALNQAVETNLMLWDIAALAPTVLINRGQFDHMVIDRDFITANAEGAAVPDYAKLEPYLREHFR
jgi:anionic cell wall polymer biosynthesis LytR-Cps2A-Psr (LCP) family protein